MPTNKNELAKSWKGDRCRCKRRWNIVIPSWFAAWNDRQLSFMNRWLDNWCFGSTPRNNWRRWISRKKHKNQQSLFIKKLPCTNSSMENIIRWTIFQSMQWLLRTKGPCYIGFAHFFFFFDHSKHYPTLKPGFLQKLYTHEGTKQKRGCHGE